MTTAMPTATPHSRTRLLPLAVGASVAQMLMMIPGYSDAGSFQTGAWVSVLVISLALSLLLFLVVVPGRGPVTGNVRGVLALLSGVVFWAGLTLPLAAAAGAAAWTGFSGRQDWKALTGLSLAVLSTFAVVAIIIADAVTN